MNTLRAVLVAGTVVGAMAAVAYGQWTAAVVLTIAVAAHAWMWFFLARLRRVGTAGTAGTEDVAEG